MASSIFMPSWPFSRLKVHEKLNVVVFAYAAHGLGVFQKRYELSGIIRVGTQVHMHIYLRHRLFIYFK